MGEGAHERYLKLAEDLAARLGIAATLPRVKSCGCGH
jgi:hypothetical protein